MKETKEQGHVDPIVDSSWRPWDLGSLVNMVLLRHTGQRGQGMPCGYTHMRS